MYSVRPALAIPSTLPSAPGKSVLATGSSVVTTSTNRGTTVGRAKRPE
jgi:hypothetical protein